MAYLENWENNKQKNNRTQYDSYDYEKGLFTLLMYVSYSFRAIYLVP